ncbi:D(2) dopamine receptor-like isoform X2 [Ptychodera flava]|uniref:D(2) dopamine receptor-like isoform X2 n=1 Tax=Ptychodera flava TaxID=63121 RepID=UPI00396A0FF7
MVSHTYPAIFNTSEPSDLDMPPSPENYSNFTGAVGDNFTLGVRQVIPLVALALIGIVGNGLVLVVYGKRRRKTCPHYFIMTLAANDLFICSVIFPYILYSHMVDNFTNAAACKTFTYTWFVSIGNSLLITEVIAVDRYNAICRPLYFSSTLNMLKKAKVVVVACYVFSLIFALPVFFMLGILSYRERHHGAFVYMCGYVCDPKLDLVFYRVLFALYCVLVVSTLVLYSKIIMTVRTQIRIRNRTLGLQRTDKKLSGLSTMNMSVLSNRKDLPQRFERHTFASSSSKVNSVQGHDSGSSDSTSMNRADESEVSTPIGNLNRMSSGGNIDDHVARETNFIANSDGQRRNLKFDSAQEKDGNNEQSKTVAGNEGVPSLARRGSLTSTSTTSGGSRQGRLGPTMRAPRQRKTPMLSKRTGIDRTVLMLMLVTVVFVFSWMPLFVFSFIPKLNWRHYDTYPSPVKYLTFLYFVNNFLNPFIYSFVNKKFRRDVVAVLKSFRCNDCLRKLTPPPQIQ